MIQAQFDSDFNSWRTEARKFLQQKIVPDEIVWTQSSGNFLLFAESNFPKTSLLPKNFNVPKEFVEKAQAASMARDEDRWGLIYRILFRLAYEDPNLMKISIDPDIARLNNLWKAIRRDIHKMYAFVRFKRTEIHGQEIYVAWHRPEHLIVKEGALFFMRRFGDKPWSIFTPDLSAHWNGIALTFTEGIPQHQFPHKDNFDDLWKTYYSSIFNPARIKIKAMKAEMATKYWEALPEAEIIAKLIKQAPKNLQDMAARQNKQAFVPPTKNISELHELAKKCEACPLKQHATNLVFGVGSPTAELMIVGEQPGDTEDLEGKPFVGPSGQLLEGVIKSLNLNRDEIYVTNAVKHFKWKPQNITTDGVSKKIRLHQKPTGTEMHACRPWLEAEISHVKPKVILALGTTAGTSILGRLPKIGEERNKPITNSPFADVVILSWHPSAILRAMNDEDKRKKLKQLHEDLALAVSLLNKKP